MLFDTCRKKQSMKQIIIISIFIFTFFPGNAQNFENNYADKNRISVETQNSSTDVNIYPNPVKHNKLTIKFKHHQIKEIRLTNILGKEVLLKHYQNSLNEIVLELTNIPNGIYLVRIKTTDNQIVVKKLMVSRN